MRVKLFAAPTVAALTGFLGTLPATEKNLIFCEDRLTLEVERAVAAAQGAAFFTEVTTFARFLGGQEGKNLLSKQGSVMVVGNIAAQCADRLCYFGKNPAGCAGRLYETIAQLRAALVTPAMLEEARAGADKLLAEKLADIARIYREYLTFLESGYLDESGMLSLLPAAIERAQLQDTNVVFAGFTSFTRQAAEGIDAALRTAKSVCAVLIGGEEDLYTNEAAAAFTRLCARAGAECEQISLPSGLIPEAEALRRALFDPSYPAPVSTSRVFAFEAADRNDEALYLAAMIKNEVARGARYRDISLFLPDMAGYRVPLEKAFGEYRIPFYADVRKSLAEHPLAAFVRGWFSLLSEGFEPSDVDAFVGNRFFGGDVRSRELYRNYLWKHANYRGGVRRPIKETAENPLVFGALRERLLRSFAGANPTMDARAYCACVRRLLELFECRAEQERTAAQLERAGMRAESEFFLRGVDGVERVVSEAEALAGGRKMRAEEFAAILGEGLAELEVSLIPQYTDAVFVGDLSQSRRGNSKIVFAAGLTDAVPGGGADTALISDRDIDRLRTLQVEIQPKIREVNARVRETTGLALCGFTERLYLSYPVTVSGEECKKSQLLDTAFALFCTAKGAPLPLLTRARLEDSARTDAAAYRRYLSVLASERVPAVRELLVRADEYRRGKKDFSAHTGLYAALRERGEAPAEWLFSPPPRKDFVPNAAQVIFRGKNTVSPTLIEGYFHCPYRNFAERGLLLSEREEASVRVTDTGDFMHELLRRLAEAMPTLSDADACEAFLRERTEELLAQPPFSDWKDTATGSYSAAALRAEAVLVGRNVFEQLRGSDFTVLAAEQTFGYPSSPFPGIRLTAGGRTLTIAGKIDRVDESGEYRRVIDYKTGQFDTGAENYYTGRKLQLELYLSAVAANGKAAGAYYFPAKVSFNAKDADSPFRMQGFTVEDDEVVRRSDTAVEEGQKSRFIDAYYRSRKGKKSLPPRDFADFLAYSVLAAENCARETAAGCIAASPYEGACTYCPYGAVCGFDRSGGARSEKKVTGEEIVQIVRHRRGEV